MSTTSTEEQGMGEMGPTLHLITAISIFGEGLVLHPVTHHRGKVFVLRPFGVRQWWEEPCSASYTMLSCLRIIRIFLLCAVSSCPCSSYLTPNCFLALNHSFGAWSSNSEKPGVIFLDWLPKSIHRSRLCCVYVANCLCKPSLGCVSGKKTWIKLNTRSEWIRRAKHFHSEVKRKKKCSFLGYV